MTDFLEQCRDQWRRLGVPEQVAEEMAADLASDVAEAEADGISAEELLGSDPRSFAASLAAERGVAPAPSSPGKPRRRRPFALVAFTVVAAIVLIFAARGLLTGQPRATLVATGPRPHFPSSSPFPVVPSGGPHRVFVLGNLAAPIEWVLLVFAIVALGFAVWLWLGWSRSRPPGALT